MERYDVAQKVFDYMESNGFKAYNIKRGDGYFVFDMGEDSVIHFKVKGIHGWLFAMWININEEELHNENGEDYPALQFFCQPELTIDKFKPSRSYFCEKYSYDDVVDDYDSTFYAIVHMLKHIKYHPFIAFCNEWEDDRYLIRRFIVGAYLKALYYESRYRSRKWFEQIPVYYWTKFKAMCCKLYEVVDHIEIVDENKNGFVCSPRYDCTIHFKSLYDEEKQELHELKVINTWFKKNRWNAMYISCARDDKKRYWYF